MRFEYVKGMEINNANSPVGRNNGVYEGVNLSIRQRSDANKDPVRMHCLLSLLIPYMVFVVEDGYRYVHWQGRWRRVEWYMTDSGRHEPTVFPLDGETP